MTYFIRLLADLDKEKGLQTCTDALRSANRIEPRIYELAPEAFHALPGAPFAYWVSNRVRSLFEELTAFETDARTARQGLATAEDFRFLRLWWEGQVDGWYGFAKGGKYSPFYSDVFLTVKWKDDGAEIKAGICQRYPYLNGNAEFVAKNPQFYLRPGLTWPRRTKSKLSMRVLPKGCIFADKGPATLVEGDDEEALFCLLSICQSRAFHALVELQLAAGDERPGGAAHSFEVGVIQRTPVPEVGGEQQQKLIQLARRGWHLHRTLDTADETSHAFELPNALLPPLQRNRAVSVNAELESIQAEIDEIAFGIYGFSEADRDAAIGPASAIGDAVSEDADALDENEDDESGLNVDLTEGLLSWAVGVAFGRFDWRLATGEREAPPEPDPFDPLPAKSPGMLPDSAAPFHAHIGILLDDQGHPHDLPRLIEEVVARVEAEVPGDVRRWLQRDFFPLHLQQYSKSRRKAPIYWPLSTTSGSYTLWLYYPSISSQTLYSAVNDFVEPKLKQVSREADVLRDKGAARSRDDEKTFEALQALELELIELRDSLLQIAPTYRPNHDDGVQITAAPLWQLFRHKPWQKLLKDTWAKLEKGEYDWSHLAMAYWPDRVREKCKTDKSLAIAHDLEHLYVEPQQKPAKAGGRKKRGGA